MKPELRTNEKKRRCSVKSCRTKLVDGRQVIAMVDGGKIKAYLCSDDCLRQFDIDKTGNT